MKIAILDSSGSFHDGRLGATHSVMRWLFYHICAEDMADVTYIDVHGKDAGLEAKKHGIHWIKTNNVIESLEAIHDKDFDHVLSRYFPAKDRLAYALMRRRFAKWRTRFHQMYFFWPDKLLKREFSILDSRIAPFNGRVFGCSPRLFLKLREYAGENAALLLPPVPDDY